MIQNLGSQSQEKLEILNVYYFLYNVHEQIYTIHLLSKIPHYACVIKSDEFVRILGLD